MVFSEASSVAEELAKSDGESSSEGGIPTVDAVALSDEPLTAVPLLAAEVPRTLTPEPIETPAVPQLEEELTAEVMHENPPVELAAEEQDITGGSTAENPQNIISPSSSTALQAPLVTPIIDPGETSIDETPTPETPTTAPNVAEKEHERTPSAEVVESQESHASDSHVDEPSVETQEQETQDVVDAVDNFNDVIAHSDTGEYYLCRYIANH